MRLIPLLFLVACGPKTDDPAVDETDDETSAADSGTLLSSLKLSEGTLEPTFSSTQRNYGVGAPVVTSTTEIIATPVDPNAVVTIEQATIDGVTIASSGASHVGLAVDQQLVITVTAADGASSSTYFLGVQPGNLPEMTVETPGEADPGYYFLSNFTFGQQPNGIGRYLLIVDGAGVPIWWRSVDGEGFDFRVQPGGDLSYIGQSPTLEHGGVVLDGSTHAVVDVWHPMTTQEGNPNDIDVHEFRLLKNGNPLILGMSPRSADLSGEGLGQVVVLDNILQELDAGGSRLFEWSTEEIFDLDDLPQAFQNGIGDGFEYAHVNSIDIDPDDDNFVISARFSSEIYKVDADTGDVLWTLGGPSSDFTFVGEDRGLTFDGFAGQHSARALGDGRLLVFDNALDFDRGETGDCRYVEYALDTNAMTATLERSYVQTGGGFCDAAGSVQRLASGHTVLGWGNLDQVNGKRAPAITEVDENDEVVFELFLPETQWSYRAFKFDRDDTGKWIYTP